MKIYIFLFNGFSDWEIAYLTPEINKNDNYELIYFSIDGKPIKSMGGLEVIPGLSLAEVSRNDIDVLILPGGISWDSEENHKVKSLVMETFSNKKIIAAICAATAFLGDLGILDNLKHTSNDLNYLKAVASNYRGEANYLYENVAVDQNIITANGVSTIEFAREIFRKIRLMEELEIEKWYQLFKNGVWT